MTGHGYLVYQRQHHEKTWLQLFLTLCLFDFPLSSDMARSHSQIDVFMYLRQTHNGRRQEWKQALGYCKSSLLHCVCVCLCSCMNDRTVPKYASSNWSRATKACHAWARYRLLTLEKQSGFFWSQKCFSAIWIAECEGWIELRESRFKAVFSEIEIAWGSNLCKMFNSKGAVSFELKRPDRQTNGVWWRSHESKNYQQFEVLTPGNPPKKNKWTKSLHRSTKL